jgi:glutathione S-transferase
VTTLYRCKTPTDLVCRCGKVARRLRSMEIDFEEIRAPFLERDRPEVEELTGQRWVPVLVHDKDVILDSHRILEYLEMARPQRTPTGKHVSASRGSKAVTNARRLWPYMLMAWERWQSLPPEQKERYVRQARQAAEQGKKVLDKRLKRRS